MDKNELQQYAKEYACIKVIHDKLIPNMYTAIMSKAQSDTKFEKLIQAMTINRIRGGNSLDKYKEKF